MQIFIDHKRSFFIRSACLLLSVETFLINLIFPCVVFSVYANWFAKTERIPDILDRIFEISSIQVGVFSALVI